MKEKLCIACGSVKPIEEFSPNKPKTQFKTSKQSHRTYCKACVREKAAKWRADKPGYRGSGRTRSIDSEYRAVMSAIRQRLVDARSRCRKLKREAPTTSDLHLLEVFKSQQGKCALSGVTLSLEKDHPHCLSLDKIDPSKGYEDGNVQWLSWYVNRAKGEMTLEVFLSMCETVLDYQKVQRLSKSGES